MKIMKISVFTILMFLKFSVLGQIEKIEIPKGVVYKYCDSLTYEKAKALITEELSSTAKYSLNKGILFIGPVLWQRYEKVTALKNIKGGNMTILGYKKETSTGKLTQDAEGFKLVWDYLRSEVGNAGFKLRKATASELKYYWAVISFDIEEPLIILETKEHNYILNLSPADLKLVWLDEAPRS